jgi:hypothetical protein
MSEPLIDPVTHKSRLLAAECSTCVFRPGNLMQLRPGRLGQLIRENTGANAQGLHCYQTTYGQNPGTGLALCRGFYDRFGHLANFIRVCERIGGFTEVAPPGKETS